VIFLPHAKYIPKSLSL